MRRVMCTIWMKLDHFEWFHGKMEILRCCPQRSWEFWWIMSLCEITLLKRSTSRVFCYCYRRSAEQRVTHRCIFSGTLTSILPFISLAIWSQILLFFAFLLLFSSSLKHDNSLGRMRVIFHLFFFPYNVCNLLHFYSPEFVQARNLNSYSQ